MKTYFTILQKLSSIEAMQKRIMEKQNEVMEEIEAAIANDRKELHEVSLIVEKVHERQKQSFNNRFTAKESLVPQIINKRPRCLKCKRKIGGTYQDLQSRTNPDYCIYCAEKLHSIMSGV